MTEIAKTFEAEHITDQLRQLSHSDMERLSVEKKTELITAINSKLEALKKDKKNGNIAKAGTELRQILYDVRRLDLQKLVEKSETVQEVKSQLAALEGVENSLNTSDKAREAMGKMKISDDSPEGVDMQPGEIINAQKGWDISKALNGLNLSTATSEQLPALLNIIEKISNTRYDLVYKEGGKIDSIVKEEGGPEKYLNVYSEFKSTFARLRNEADTNALKTIDLRGVQDDPNIGDKISAQGLDTINYDYQLKDGVLTRTNKTSKITDYRNDVANIWETQQEREARLAQEKIKEEEPGKIADIIAGEHATGDSIDASGHGFDPAYSYTRTEDSITRTKDGKTDTWDTEGKKWVSEADQNARIAKENETIEGTDEYKEKMRTIFEEMKSNPDVYSESDTGKETYEFNGQQLSLEGEEPNQYLTRVVDGKTEQFDVETGEWSIDETTSTNGFFLTDKSGARIELKKGEMREADGSNFFVTEDGQTIAIRKKDAGRDKVTEYYQILKDGKWVNLNTEDLSPQNQSQLFLAQYGDWGMPDNLNFRNTKIANIGNMLSYQTNVNFRSSAGDFLRKLQKDLDKSPGMGQLTLQEYNDFNKNPDSFAKSEFVPQRINLQFTDPEYYGVDTKGYEYARDPYGQVIKRPKVGANMDNTMVSERGKDFESQRSWLERNIATFNTNTPYVVPGSENLRFSKQENGDVYVFNNGEPDKKIETYAQGKWEKVSGKV